MTTTTSVQRIDRAAVQRWLPVLDEWLLPGSFYGVGQTWPQLYRSDGAGSFFVVAEDDRLLSHCAVRFVTLRTAGDRTPVALVGSVATEPGQRGRGLASAVLTAAVEDCALRARGALLWAERPGLYARHGFLATAPEPCLLLARKPRREQPGVRLATVEDHAAMHALHAAKPCAVERTPAVMSMLLTTPGMTTVVLERDGRVVAYACTGKGADLQGHWHELGGSDEDLAVLLPAAMHVAEQTEAALLLPPYRARLGELLRDQVVAEAEVPGPMARWFGAAPARCWIDGLDSV